MKPSLKYGREAVAIPGPSVIPDRVLEAFSQAMPDLYSGSISEVIPNVREGLPAIARTDGEVFIVIGNGHAAWQMATTNTLAAGDKVLALEAGRFATVWARYTGVSDVDVEMLPGSDRGPVDPVALQQRLTNDTDHEIRAILVAHVDTASSVRNDIPALRAAIDAANHPALFMVDCIASMGCEPFEMDAWGVDIAIAGSQKGLMVPPGISFVWVNDKAAAAYERADMRVGYFDWESRRDVTNNYAYFSGTPPIPHLRGMQVALDLIEEEGGIEAVWARHAALGAGVKAAVAAWSVGTDIDFNITDPASRSDCVTTVLTGSIDRERLRQLCAEQAGLTLGLGLNGFEGFRIGHMGHLNPPMILGTLGTIEAALHAMGVPLSESGVAAAASTIGSYL